MSTEDTGYQEFLRNVQPSAVGLDSCKTSLDRTAFGRLEDPAKIVNRLHADYRLIRTEKDHFDVGGRLKITIGDDVITALSLECEISGHFHAASPVNNTFADRFAQAEARLFLWPYFREFVSNLTSRMSIPPVTLPLTLRQLADPSAERALPAGKPKKRVHRAKK